MTIYRLTIIATLCVSLARESIVRAQDLLPEPIRVGLAGYADLDPLAVTATVTVEATPLGQKKIAADLLEIISRAQVQQVAIREGRIYVRREPKAAGAGKFDAVMAEAAFDRKVIYFGDRHRGLLSKWLPGRDQPAARHFTVDYFRAAGIRLATRVRDLLVPWRPQSELIALIGEGGRVRATGPINLEGLALVHIQLQAKDPSKEVPPISAETQLRPPGVSEQEIQRQLKEAQERHAAGPPERLFDFYLDPDRGYAVRRLETRDEQGRLLIRCDCTEHEQLTGRKVWLPRRCREEKYVFDNLPNQVFTSPLFIRDFDVTEFDLKPWPDERFELNYTKPGTYVDDATFPEVKGTSGVRYTVPATPKQLDEVIDAARKNYQSHGGTEKWSSVLRWLFLSVNVALLIGLAVFVYVRRRKATST